MSARLRTKWRRLRMVVSSSVVLAALSVLAGCAGSLWPTDADFNICPDGDEPVGSVRLSQTANVAMRVGDVLQVNAELLDGKSAPMYLCVPATT